MQIRCYTTIKKVFFIEFVYNKETQLNVQKLKWKECWEETFVRIENRSFEGKNKIEWKTCFNRF